MAHWTDKLDKSKYTKEQISKWKATSKDAARQFKAMKAAPNVPSTSPRGIAYRENMQRKNLKKEMAKKLK